MGRAAPGAQRTCPQGGLKLAILGVTLLLVAFVAFASFQLLRPTGWSPDVLLDDGRMRIRLQHKVDPAPDGGAVTLMARVKRDTGTSMTVERVLFAVTRDGEAVVEGLAGHPIGAFEPYGDGYYAATTALAAPGSYTLEVRVEHGQSRFSQVFPFEVKRP